MYSSVRNWQTNRLAQRQHGPRTTLDAEYQQNIIGMLIGVLIGFIVGRTELLSFDGQVHRPGAGVAHQARDAGRISRRSHVGAYTSVLFLAGIFGERPKSSKEIVLATERALEQQALEAWQLQKQADIAEMLRRGEPLAPVAAALASPETAERIALLEAATAGQMNAIDAARLNLHRAGHDVSLLDGLSTDCPGCRGSA